MKSSAKVQSKRGKETKTMELSTLGLQNRAEWEAKGYKLPKFDREAVTKATNELKDFGLINKDLYGEITLTEVGKNLAEKIYDKHMTIYSFLQKLGVSEETAEDDCCKLEHAISEETLQKLKEFLNK